VIETSWLWGAVVGLLVTQACMGVWIYTGLSVLSDEIRRAKESAYNHAQGLGAGLEVRLVSQGKELQRVAQEHGTTREATAALAAKSMEVGDKLEGLARALGYVWEVGLTTETVRKSHWQPVARVVTEEKP
jgi:hypothetical protein